MTSCDMGPYPIDMRAWREAPFIMIAFSLHIQHYQTGINCRAQHVRLTGSPRTSTLQPVLVMLLYTFMYSFHFEHPQAVFPAMEVSYLQDQFTIDVVYKYFRVDLYYADNPRRKRPPRLESPHNPDSHPWSWDARRPANVTTSRHRTSHWRLNVV